MTFGEILARFKGMEKDSPESVAPLLDNVELRNGLVSWRSVSIRYRDASDCHHKDETSQWNWLWQQIEYDKSTFGTVAGIKPAQVDTLITRLMGLRLIYPDGTINTMAKQYLSAMIMAKITGPRRGRPPTKKNDTPSKKPEQTENTSI